MAGRSATKRTSPRRTGRSRESSSGGTTPPTVTTVNNVIKAEGPDGSGGSGFSGFVSFLQGVKVEFNRVTWPTGSEVRKATVAVMFLLIVFSLYLGLLDKILIAIFHWGMRR